MLGGGIETVQWFVARDTNVDLVTKDGVNIHDMTADISVLHRLDGVPSAHQHAQYIRVQDRFQVFRVVLIGEERFCEESAVVDEQVNPAECFLDPGVGALDGSLIGYVTLDCVQLTFDLEETVS